MSKQTIQNMENVLLKIKQTVFTEMLNGEYKHESTQIIKTLINTYQTMLNTFMQMSAKEFKECNAKQVLENQAEDIFKVMNTIESVTIPKLMELGKYKGVDNLTLVVDKGRKIIRNINPHRDFNKEKVLFETDKKTKELLEVSVNSGVLIKQIDDSLRGTGKTVSIIEKAISLNCAILTLNKMTVRYVEDISKELNESVTAIPSTDINYISLPQYSEQVNNGFLVDDIGNSEVLHKLKEKGYKILGGFIS